MSLYSQIESTFKSATSKRFRRWCSSDEMGLLILGVLCVCRAILRFLPVVEHTHDPLHWVEHWYTPPFWSLAWLATGLLCIFSITVRRLQPLAVGAVVGFHLIWAMSFLGSDPNTWLLGLTYFCVFAICAWAFSRGRQSDTYIPRPPRLPDDKKD